MKRVLIYGAGSIGKSVCGVCFKKAGAGVLFADIDAEGVADLKRRGEYRIYTGKDAFERISGVSAVMSSETPSLIGETDFVCTAVGERGLEPVLRTVAAGLNPSRKEPLMLLLCENIPHVFDTASEIMRQAAPDGTYFLAECSVERMTKLFVSENGERDVLAEPFIPLIINRNRYGCCEFLSAHSELFLETDRFVSYYYRKIHTNNMGHAVLGYLGHKKGYKYLADAVADADIRACLMRCLESAGKMLTALYGFSDDEIRCHLSGLLKRFENPGLNDEISRVIRSPKRKLSGDERIIGTILKCKKAGVDTEPFYPIAAAALGYRDNGDPESLEIGRLIAELGINEAVRLICGLGAEPDIADRIAYHYAKG